MAGPQVELRDVFCAALERQTPQEQADYLDEACRGKPELRARVEALLRANEEASSFLREPSGRPAPTLDEPIREKPGSVIGPYKLLEQIGEGGFGVVFMAEQTQPVRRRVALKVLKPGMDTRQIVARFEAERQALAIMDHPNIAKVHDGGATASGRPYFVMELVKGVPITEFCDQHQMTPRQRLELFVHVCQAVQHAHHKGIIHRDLKPSNVLVTIHDTTPVVKVIDFGVAKALGQELTDKTLFTGFAQMVGTPLYMSPEQAGQSGLDIDTRSDIYSLGVLLYELLTGTTPFTKERFKQAAYEEIRRIIREEEPPRPSTRLSELRVGRLSKPSQETPSGHETPPASSLASISALRHTEPTKLTKLVKGELDWIVMKALEKDRNRRYETANGFAMDVQRYLSDEPVQACPPSLGYRLRKFTRRNKRVLIAGALVVVALVLGIAGSTWQAIEATVARDAESKARKEEREARDALDAARAEQEQQRAHLNQALSDVLIEAVGARAKAQAAGPADTKHLGRLREAIRRAQALAESELADAHLVAQVTALRAELDREDANRRMAARLEEIRLEMAAVKGETFDRVGSAAAYEAEYHKYGLPILKLEPAEAARRVAASPISGALIAGLDIWAHVVAPAIRKQLLTVAQGADNDAWRRQCRDAFLLDDGLALAKLAQQSEALKQTAFTLVRLGDYLAAHDLAAAVVLLKHAQQQHPADFWVNHQLAGYLVLMGPAHTKEAIGFSRVALALRPQSAGVYVNFGTVLKEGGALEEAMDAYKQAIQLKPDYAAPHIGLGNILAAKGRLDEAIAEYQEAIRINKDLAMAHYNLGNALHAKGRLDEALAEYREAIRLKKDYAEAHHNLGTALRDKGLLDEAIAEYRQAVKKGLPYAHMNLGVALFDKGRMDEAIAEFREAIRLKKDYAEAHMNLGNALHARGRLEEAIARYREAIRIKKDFPEAHMNLANALRDKGQPDEAIAEYREAIRLNKDYADAHYGLGNGLCNKGQLDEAIAEYRQAIRIKRGFAKAHNGLGNALQAKGQLDEAIAEFREAIRLKNYAAAHLGLGNALRDKGQMDKAIAEFREAIRLQKDLAEAHCNLGLVLRRQGEFHQALAALRRGHEFGSQRPGWPYPSAQWVRHCERLIDLDGRSVDFMAGKIKPASAHEGIELAELCALKRLNRAAARFYEGAFVAPPEVAAKLLDAHRYNAACAASLAGCGRGDDAGKLKDEERARLRKQALDWLRADLAIYAKRLQGANARDRTRLQQQLEYWQRDDDLIGIRDSAALAKLPGGERAACEQLWADVETLLRKTRDQQKQ